MIVYLVAASVLAYVVLSSGQRADGRWRFAPLRATGMLAGGVFRIAVFVAVFVFALTLGALFGTVRSSFRLAALCSCAWVRVLRFGPSRTERC